MTRSAPSPSPAPSPRLSGAKSVEWRDISRHSSDNAPLNEDGERHGDDGAGVDGKAVVVRGAPTPDEVAAVIAALARRTARSAGVDDPYERWRQGRIAVRSRAADAR